MKYGIRCNILKNNNEITISEEEFLDIKFANSALFEALALEELLDHILENYIEWESDLLRLATQNMIFSNSDIHSQRRLLNRRMINILTTCRMYVDQAKSISRKISLNVNPEEIEKIFNEIYDANQSYRIMEALRNFSQHHGVPIHVLTQSYRHRGLINQGKSIVSLIPCLKTERVIGDSQFKKSVAQEIRDSKAIDLRKTTREYVSKISEAHALIKDKLRADIERLDQIFFDCIKKYKERFPENDALRLGAYSADEKGHSWEWVFIFDELIKNRKDFENCRSNLKGLIDFEVTNTDFE